MFGKLIKYEIKAAGKWYLMTYALSLGLSLFFGLAMKAWLGQQYGNFWANSEFGDLQTNLQVFTFIALAILAFGLTMATIFLIINRFHKNVYGREGYLTMTLPVTSHQLILSKLAAASIWMFLSSFTCLLSFFFYFLPSMNIGEILRYLPEAIASFHAYVPIPLVLISSFISHLSGVLLIYLAISIGQLFQNRRGLMGFVAYFALYLILSFIISFVTPREVYTEFFGKSYFTFVLITSSIQAIAFYFATHYIMTKRLNIQ